eukprot:SAG11_NODE_1487_length_4818_cov_37.715194_4_plen_88_part_00
MPRYRGWKKKPMQLWNRNSWTTVHRRKTLMTLMAVVVAKTLAVVVIAKTPDLALSLLPKWLLLRLRWRVRPSAVHARFPRSSALRLL